MPLIRLGLSLAAVGLASCGPPPCTGASCDAGGTPSLTFTLASAPLAIGTGVEGTISATNCPGARFALWQGPLPGTKLVDLNVVGGGGTFLAPTDAFRDALARTIPARLSVFAAVECSSGRRATSAERALTFFPVADVPPASTVFLERFEVEGTGSTASLIGCAQLDGVASLVRLSATGALLKAVPAPFPCVATAELSAPSSTAAKRLRWLVQRGGGVPNGVIAFVSQAGAADDLSTLVWRLGTIDAVGTSADGQAVVFGGDAPAKTLTRLDPRQAAPQVWQVSAPPGRANADPRLSGSDVFVSVFDEVIGSTQASVVTYRYALSSGAQLSRTVVTTYVYASALDPKEPVIGGFSTTGEQLYLPRWFTSAGQEETAAVGCPTLSPGCQTPSLVTGRVPGRYFNVIPHGGSLLLAGRRALTAASLPSGTLLLSSPVVLEGALEFVALSATANFGVYALAQGPLSAPVEAQSQELIAMLKRGAQPTWRLPSLGLGPAGSLWIAPDGELGAILRVGDTYVRTLTPRRYCELESGLPCF